MILFDERRNMQRLHFFDLPEIELLALLPCLAAEFSGRKVYLFNSYTHVQSKNMHFKDQFRGLIFNLIFFS